jgi:patatin-like phospholipase/acyl hydrolase
MKPQLRILSIDGGGIRGIISCTILEFIESQLGDSLASHFDLIVGTSTGGIITMGLARGGNAKPYSAKELLDLYKKSGHRIFHARNRDFLSRIMSFSKTTAELTQKAYDESGIEELFNTYFGDSMLRDAATNVLVTTFDVARGKPFYFSSRLAREDQADNFAMKEVARSTSAAPTYFGPSMLDSIRDGKLIFVDGGVFANNPSILAYAEAKEIWRRRKDIKGFEAKVTPDNNDLPFFMLSIGTGFTVSEIDTTDIGNWRTSGWIKPLLTNIFMRSVAESTDYSMRHLLPPYTTGGTRYERVDVAIPLENSEMDDASAKNIEALCKLGERAVRANETRLLEICQKLQ